MSVVALISDFGTCDPHVAEMKAALLRLGPPGVRLIDVTHAVPPGDVAAGGGVLARIWGQFPAGTVVLAVVDPGVGTDRAAVAAGADGRWFVGPGNGLAAHLSGRDPVAVRRLDRFQPPPGLTPSTTFHGRDLFAPAAAHLAGGGDPADLGPAGCVADLGPVPTRDGKHRVVWIDRFGNLITDLARTDQPGRALADGGEVEVAGRRVPGPRDTYAVVPPGRLFWYWGSGDTLEIALNGDSAAALLGAKPGLVITTTAS